MGRKSILTSCHSDRWLKWPNILLNQIRKKRKTNKKSKQSQKNSVCRADFGWSTHLETHQLLMISAYLTSWWGCPLQAPPAPHQRRAERRWSYICPSFCPHQNSAWGGERPTTNGATFSKKKKAFAGKQALFLLVLKSEYSLWKDVETSVETVLPNVSNWQRCVSDGHQRPSLIQEKHTVLFLKNLHRQPDLF